MRVVIERTGGFAGIEEEVASYDTEHLAAEDAAEVRRAVERIAAASAREESTEVGADLVNYRITAGGRVLLVSADPAAALAGPLSVLLRQRPA
ncbi:protealysin inhibitor emfourin [Marinitenerispora sediminis]|uniref:protealysin inhibitor emfourin n=1 Tax=Marinitenerispora sediminis TaxID=1931232 RepID=UPI000DF387FA|nr:protealysin inhibitor emfourin [Marinitenerispora sediminis]RCV48652.1 hypothetical protein DEF23_24745 [Marinitenerispora sediminis]RCV51705.1 hypothetical protein DEF28_14740 [Marinitenerispora sediminis]